MKLTLWQTKNRGKLKTTAKGKLLLLGLCRRWPLARCRAEMERKAALQSLMRLNGRFLIDATADPDPLQSFAVTIGQRQVSGASSSSVRRTCNAQELLLKLVRRTH